MLHLPILGWGKHRRRGLSHLGRTISRSERFRRFCVY